MSEKSELGKQLQHIMDTWGLLEARWRAKWMFDAAGSVAHTRGSGQGYKTRTRSMKRRGDWKPAN